MTQKALIHTILLAFAILSIFLWVSDPILPRFNLQLTALLMLILILTRYLIKPDSFKLVESIISTQAVLLIIYDTGNLTSPLFFLNFFLLFELSLLLEPSIPLVLSIFLGIYYYLLSPYLNISNYTILLAFPFITPMAIFLGKIYRREEDERKTIGTLEKKISKLEKHS